MPYQLSPSPWHQFIDPNGVPYANGRLYTYESGTTNPATVYRDAIGTPHSNPIILDAYGQCAIYLPSDNKQYKFVLHDQYDVPVRSQDDISLTLPAGSEPVPNLNADLLDGLNSDAFLQVPLPSSGVVQHLNADLLDGLDATAFVRAPLPVPPQAWPVGSVFISVVPTNPASLLGYGTWVQFAVGRTLVGLDPSQGEFNSPELMGGAKTHVHTVWTGNAGGHAHAIGADGNHDHIVPSAGPFNLGWQGNSGSIATIDGFNIWYWTNNGGAHYGVSATGNLGPAAVGASAPAHTHPNVSVAGNHSHGGATAGVGDHAHAAAMDAQYTLSPYIVTYMWKRTA